MRALILCAALLLPASAYAQVVYKCVGPKGQVAYRSTPCSANERVQNIYDATPERYSPQREAERKRLRRSIDEGARRWSNLAGTDGGTYRQTWSPGPDPNSRHARCEAAKANREATLERVGLARTFDLLRRLDEIVWEACNGK